MGTSKYSEKTYSGKVKFYDFKKGFGFVGLDEKIEYNGETIEDDLYLTCTDIIFADGCNRIPRNFEVKFKVTKDDKGFKAVNVQNSEGKPIDRQPRKRKMETEETEKADPAPAKKQKTAEPVKTAEDSATA